MSNSEEGSSSGAVFLTPNPTGKNQYSECPPANDERVRTIITKYYQDGNKDQKLISRLLLTEHGIKMSPSTVSSRKRAFGLMSSHKTTQTLPETKKRQLVLDALEDDPARRQGPRLIKERIERKTGFNLTKNYVRLEMQKQDPEGFELRDPTSRKIKRGTLVNLGPHEEWSGDGHDKLKQIGFPVYGIRDVWSGKWLGLWVMPNNRLKEAVAYLWLSLVYDYGGIPLQMTTDCGTETVLVFGFANALREAFTDMSVDELPAHRFLKSIYNITIERGWSQLKIQFCDNVKEFWARGELDGIYDPDNSRHIGLAQWLWPLLIQKGLDSQRDFFNSHKTRKDKRKHNPSGVAPNVAFTLYEEHSGVNCLQKIPDEYIALIAQMMEDLGGEELLEFVPPQFAERCEEALESLGVTEVTFQNIWDVFQALLPLVF